VLASSSNREALIIRNAPAFNAHQLGLRVLQQLGCQLRMRTRQGIRDSQPRVDSENHRFRRRQTADLPDQYVNLVFFRAGLGWSMFGLLR
jgi:hypothetical protein